MSEFLGLRTVIYHVDDLERAKEWYTRALGLPPYFDQPFYVGFNVAGYELGLQPRDPGAAGDGPAARRETVVTYWGVKDARAAVARLLDLGARPRDDVQDVGEGILIGAVVDPFGNALGIIENPHFTLPD
jgi:catechol 2,3-dioxygenase-like lactoylglutathione lyase family enzyme